MNKMDSDRYLRHIVHAICWAGASTLTLSGIAMPSSAAAADASGSSDELAEIVVTGIRASLQASLDIKRSSDGIVDAISAEDIGKFPDANLAQAMERIPGVTVSHSAVMLGGTGSTSTTGAAAEITVRGFGPQFTETLFDGRQVPTAIGNRGFDFGSVGSDFVGQIDVMKTPDSTLSSGAIGATVNIKYPKPFDHPGLQVAGSLSGNENSGEKKIKPNGGILFSDTFADDRFGILADFAYNESDVRGNHINIQGWEGRTAANGLDQCQLASSATPCVGGPNSKTANPTIRDWFIQDYGVYQEHTDDKRIGGRLVFQAKPVDGLEITVDDNFSQEKIQQYQYGFSAWFNNNAMSNVTQAPDGTVTSFVQTFGSNSPNGTPTDFQAQINNGETRLNTIGLNVKWDVTEHAGYLFDAYTATSQLLPVVGLDADVGYGNNPATGNSLGIVVPGGKNVPYPINFGPNGNGAEFTNPAIVGSHVLVESYNQNKDVLNQFKLEGHWADDSLKFKYGVQFTHEHYVLRGFTDLPYTWQMYAGYGPMGSGGVAIPANLLSNTYGTSNFIHGWGDTGNLPGSIFAANGYAILNYLQGLNGVGMNGANDTKTCSNLTGGVPCTGKYIMYPNLGGNQDIIESTVSPYMSLSSSTKLADMPLRISVGARLEDTHVNSEGLAALPFGQMYILPNDHTAYGFQGIGTAMPLSTKTDYRYLLPNLDLSLGITDSIKARFDASRTLTRAPLTDLTPDLNVPSGQRVGGLTATGGNPTLLPYLSDNLDLGVEWYYARNSYVSADVFVKEVTNFIVGGTVPQKINGITLPDGTQAVFSVTSQVNGPSAEVRGLELAWQYTIADTGFGFLANATFVGTNKPYNPNDLSTSGFAVTGLANSYNFIPFYEKYGFQARVAINHRAEYLDTFGQLQNGSNFGTEPTFVDAATYVDFSTSYDINRHLNVYFTAQNLTDQIYSTHGRFKEQVLDIVDAGRTFTLGVHFKL